MSPPRSSSISSLISVLLTRKNVIRMVSVLAVATIVYTSFVGSYHSFRSMTRALNLSSPDENTNVIYTPHSAWSPLTTSQRGRMGEKGYLLSDLGQEAEDAYNLGGEEMVGSSEGYLEEMEGFVRGAFPGHLQQGMIRSLRRHFDVGSSKNEVGSTGIGLGLQSPSAMIDYPLIHQTDKSLSDEAQDSITAWETMNANVIASDGKEWKVDFYDDEQAIEWLKSLRTREGMRLWEMRNRGGVGLGDGGQKRTLVAKEELDKRRKSNVDETFELEEIDDGDDRTDESEGSFEEEGVVFSDTEYDQEEAEQDSESGKVAYGFDSPSEYLPDAASSSTSTTSTISEDPDSKYAGSKSILHESNETLSNTAPLHNVDLANDDDSFPSSSSSDSSLDESFDTEFNPDATISRMEWAYSAMRRGVLRADYFRYLIVLFRGGVYSDIDTIPLLPVTQWGALHPRLFDISATDGPGWWMNIKEKPEVVIGVDVDVHALKTWRPYWPRPLGICQWTLSSSPHHPIFIDAVRRVINATEYIEDFIASIPGRVELLEQGKEEGWMGKVKTLEAEVEKGVGILPVMDHTGPGIWTDAVLAYLKARYRVTWHDLRGLARPLRIGEVLILPIMGFSPGGEWDFHSGKKDDPRAAVLHDFRGSWKSDGF